MTTNNTKRRAVSLSIKNVQSRPIFNECFTKRQREAYDRQFERWTAQQHAALRLLAYFNKLWQRCARSQPNKNGDIIKHIAISRLQGTIEPRHRHLVRFIAGIWFRQVTRGNTASGMVSSWVRIEHPELNTQMRKLVNDLTEANSDAVDEMWVVMGQKHTVEVTIKTTVKFETDEEAHLFAELLLMKDKQ